MIRTLLLLLAILPYVIITGCRKSTEGPRSSLSNVDCGAAYLSDSNYFTDDDTLVFAVRVVYFANSHDTGDVPGLATVRNRIEEASARFASSRISFVLTAYEYHMGAPAKALPEFAGMLGRFRHFSISNYFLYGDMLHKQGSITVYVYAEPGRTEFAGVAGGIGSTFLAIRSDYFMSDWRTLEHEFGHCLGLYHVHQPDADTLGTSAASGDFVCDTHYFHSLSGRVDVECRYMGENHPRHFNVSDHIKNFMSYSHPRCRSEFTDGQIARMRWVIGQSGDLRNAIFNRLELMQAINNM